MRIAGGVGRDHRPASLGSLQERPPEDQHPISFPISHPKSCFWSPESVISLLSPRHGGNAHFMAPSSPSPVSISPGFLLPNSSSPHTPPWFQTSLYYPPPPQAMKPGSSLLHPLSCPPSISQGSPEETSQLSPPSPHFQILSRALLISDHLSLPHSWVKTAWYIHNCPFRSQTVAC